MPSRRNGWFDHPATPIAAVGLALCAQAYLLQATTHDLAEAGIDVAVRESMPQTDRLLSPIATIISTYASNLLEDASARTMHACVVALCLAALAIALRTIFRRNDTMGVAWIACLPTVLISEPANIAASEAGTEAVALLLVALALAALAVDRLQWLAGVCLACAAAITPTALLMLIPLFIAGRKTATRSTLLSLAALVVLGGPSPWAEYARGVASEAAWMHLPWLAAFVVVDAFDALRHPGHYDATRILAYVPWMLAIPAVTYQSQLVWMLATLPVVGVWWTRSTTLVERLPSILLVAALVASQTPAMQWADAATTVWPLLLPGGGLIAAAFATLLRPILSRSC